MKVRYDSKFYTISEGHIRPEASERLSEGRTREITFSSTFKPRPTLRRQKMYARGELQKTKRRQN